MPTSEVEEHTEYQKEPLSSKHSKNKLKHDEPTFLNLTSEQIKKYWQIFGGTVGEDGLDKIFVNLAFKTGENQLTIYLDNEIQKSIFPEMRTKVKAYFDKHFENNQLNIDYKVGNGKNKSSLKNQRIKKLKEEYPSFKILHDLLDLKSF